MTRCFDVIDIITAGLLTFSAMALAVSVGCLIYSGILLSRIRPDK